MWCSSEHDKDSARRILRIDRADVIQPDCDGRQKFFLWRSRSGFPAG
jgi:hypothetical protein